MLTEDRFKEGYKEISNALDSLQKAKELFADEGGIMSDLYPIHSVIKDVTIYKSHIEEFFTDFFLKNTKN